MKVRRYWSNSFNSVAVQFQFWLYQCTYYRSLLRISWMFFRFLWRVLCTFQSMWGCRNLFSALSQVCETGRSSIRYLLGEEFWALLTAFVCPCDLCRHCCVHRAGVRERRCRAQALVEGLTVQYYIAAMSRLGAPVPYSQRRIWLRPLLGLSMIAEGLPFRRRVRRLIQFETLQRVR